MYSPELMADRVREIRADVRHAAPARRALRERIRRLRTRLG